MIHSYILNVLKEVAKLQTYDVRKAFLEEKPVHGEFIRFTEKNIVPWFRLQDERKGRILDKAKKYIDAAISFKPPSKLPPAVYDPVLGAQGVGVPVKKEVESAVKGISPLLYAQSVKSKYLGVAFGRYSMYKHARTVDEFL